MSFTAAPGRSGSAASAWWCWRRSPCSLFNVFGQAPSDAIQQGLTQDDYSVTGAVIAVTTLAIVQVITSYVSYRVRPLRKVLKGEPIVLIENGKLLSQNLRRERMTADDVAEEMRTQQIPSFDQVQWAILESNGAISFIQKAS